AGGPGGVLRCEPRLRAVPLVLLPRLAPQYLLSEAVGSAADGPLAARALDPHRVPAQPSAGDPAGRSWRGSSRAAQPAPALAGGGLHPVLRLPRVGAWRC